MVRRYVGIQVNPVGFGRCCYVDNLFSPSKFTYPSITWMNCTVQRLQTEQAVHLFVVVFLTVIYTWFRCVHLFLLLVTYELFPRFGHHMTKFYEAKQNREILRRTKRGLHGLHGLRGLQVCSLAWPWLHGCVRVKAIYAIWNGFSANGFWIHFLARFWIPKAGFWIPIPSIPDSTCKNFLDSEIRITLHKAKHLS